MPRDDLFRAVELAKSFNGEATRDTATLAIISAFLDKNQNRRDCRTESQIVSNDK
jgi:hypothetical protein